MAVLVPFYQDVFNPVLFSSEAFDLSVEQKHYIQEVLEKACSDTRFAEKAYAALMVILSGGSVDTPVVGSLDPNTAVLGSPSFTLRVIGEKFDQGAKIIWNGSEEPTMFISPTELTTEVDMSTAVVAVDIPVQVRNASGAISDVSTFSLTAPASLSVQSKKPVADAKVPVKTENKIEHKDEKK